MPVRRSVSRRCCFDLVFKSSFPRKAGIQSNISSLVRRFTFTPGRIIFFCESLRLQLIRELPELVEIDTRPESEGMGDRLRRGMVSVRGGLADTGANCSIDRF